MQPDKPGLKIAADENIPFAREAFSPFGEVTLLPGRSIVAADLRDADVLLVRSVTRVDGALLGGTPVRFVGTATIGIDHIDTSWLERNGIAFADAAGSNSRSVAEYVVAALLELRERRGARLENASIGVVGVGRIGTLVMEMTRALGMLPVGYDPPRARRDGFRSASRDELLASSFITLHLPLTREGADPTYHLIDLSFLASLSEGATLINTSRGGVVDSSALAEWAGRSRADLVLDVWEGEPDVPTDLLDRCTIVTPHIAGYSLDGKVRGTAMLADALARHLRRDPVWNATEAIPPDAGTVDIGAERMDLDAVAVAVHAAYDIMEDDRALRAIGGGDETERRKGFDRLRREYRPRREFPAWRVGQVGETGGILERLGFKIP